MFTGQVSMASSIDLKRKRPMEEDYRSSPEEGFKMGEMATLEHYKAILLMVKDQMEAKYSRHIAQLQVASISAQIKLLEDFEKKSFDSKAVECGGETKNQAPRYRGGIIRSQSPTY
ncbi:BnaA08g07310D [Brassica napus]|uniref:Uncharacterized protein n=2 Tax=Brassica TaxID=3705 RepID=M4FCY1_BRACM|nr:unnamed protein product [Brassica napus]CDY47556.1 BnaA08g07310D [Brassica napus]